VITIYSLNLLSTPPRIVSIETHVLISITGCQLKVEENDSTSKMRAVGLHTNPTDQVPELDCVIL
jgi:hypothetical protein